MMNLSHENRKKVHFFLFIFVIILQLSLFYLWYNQSKAETNLVISHNQSEKPNLAYTYANEASKNYFEAETEFIEYFHDYNPESLKNYNASLSTMQLYLDSLNSLTKDEKYFSGFISDKKKKEQEIILLRLELDQLLKTDPGQQTNETFLIEKQFLKPFDSKKVLKSISYDTIKIDDEVIKKGLFGRLTDAFKGKTNIKKEQLQVTLRMVYGNTPKTGNFEDQLENVFSATDKYYNREFQAFKKIYSDIKKSDKELISINRKILKNSQEIILYYNNYIHEATKFQLETSLKNIQGKKDLILTLMIIMAFCTALLLLYSIFAYLYEKDLSLAKAEAETNLQFRNRIIGMLSHEMRAPLSIISSMTEKLKTINVQETAKEPLNLLHFTSNSLQTTIAQILSYFKSENSNLTVYNSKTNLKEEIESILESVKSLADSKKLNFEYRLFPESNEFVQIDTGKLHQLFFNTIGNALKFTDQGSVKIICELDDLEGHKKLSVKIIDTGIGIPKNDLDRVFDKFFQSKNSKAKVSFGAGLGLSLCKEIVELYNGQIGVKSELKKGTEISFELLLEKSSDLQISRKEEIIAHFKEKNIKVALVDDDKIIGKVVGKLISGVDFTPYVFSNSEEILHFLKENDIDLIVTDLQINHTSGIDLIQEIKNLNNHNSTIPIIIITGDDYMASLELTTIFADDIIIKPINPEELYQKMLKLLS